MAVNIAESEDIESIQLKESAAPATPDSGFGALYLKSDGVFYSKNDAGTETRLGGSLGVAQPTPTELTIASGAITVTQGFHRIDTQADAGTDDLDTINSLITNAWYLFKPENTGRIVKFRHGFGNIVSPTLSNVVMTAAGVWGWSDGTNLYLQTPSNPNDVDGWQSWPDSDLYIPAQDTTGKLYKVRGDEMRMHEVWTVAGGDSGGNSSSEMAIRFDDTTDRTFTLSSVLQGHSLYVKVKQVSGGTGHKLLLPMGCTWNDDGANRAVIFNSTSDWLIATAFSSTNYEVMASNGVTYAAS